LPAVVALALVVMSCARPVDPLPGYTRASSEERASLFRATADYYALRERAALIGDAAVLFAVYPQLAEGEDRSRGVNTDGFFVERIRAVGIAGLTFDIERYEPMGIYVRDETAVAFVHGVETGSTPSDRPRSGSSIRGSTLCGMRKVGAPCLQMK
jgi:hypothetical protein